MGKTLEWAVIVDVKVCSLEGGKGIDSPEALKLSWGVLAVTWLTMQSRSNAPGYAYF